MGSYFLCIFAFVALPFSGKENLIFLINLVILQYQNVIQW